MEWLYCKVCRRNHEEGRKHRFSSHHKANLTVILSKFTEKVKSARRCLARPSVIDGELEPGEVGKMWCYCCEIEIQKHITNSRVSIEWGGLLEHMTESEHHKKTRKFWWENGAETNKLQTFILFSAEYRHFKELVIEALSSLEEDNNKRLDQLAANMRAEKEQGNLTALEPPLPHHLEPCDTSTAPSHRNTPTANKKISSSSSRKNGGFSQSSVSSVSQNLTSLLPTRVPGINGNIHTGATPPWLREEEEEDSLSLIGPSLDEFILQKERNKRAGRNPNRVGADFHIQLATQKQSNSEDWLPAFGRVWNHGPRVHSKAEFLKELNTKPTPSSVPISFASFSSSSTLTPPSSSTSDPQALAPPTSSLNLTSGEHNIRTPSYVGRRMSPRDKRANESHVTPSLSHDTPKIVLNPERTRPDVGLHVRTDPDELLDLEGRVKPYIRKRKRLDNS